MTILIDGRPFAAPSAGITNFLKGSIIAWARLRPEDRFVIALPRPMHPTLNITGMPDNILFLPYSNRLLRRLPNLVWLCCMMPWLTRRWRAEAYFSPLSCLPFFLPKRMKKGIVVHDVVNLEFKETMQWTNRLSNAVFFNRSIRKADFIWTNSQYTKGRVEHYFPKRRCNDIFVGCSVDRSSYHLTTINDTEAAAIKKRHGINNRFLLFVGSLEPRKNLSFLLSLMPQLYREHQLQLVVVGGHGWKNSNIRNIIHRDGFPKGSTIFCGFVSNEELAKLYNMANCFVSASLNEGFGMPQLEALLCGCPIVTAHNSAMTEIALNKDGAYTIEGYNPQTWIDTISRVVDTRPQVNLAQLAAYDWEKIVNEFLSLHFPTTSSLQQQ